MLQRMLLVGEKEVQPARGSLGRMDQAFERLVADAALGCNAQGLLLLMLGCGSLVGSALFVWFDNPLPALAGAVAGTLVPLLYVAHLARRRMATIQEQLPGVLDCMSRAMRAGESLDQAVVFASRETAAPLGKELRYCAHELEIGQSDTHVLQSLARRVQSTDMRILVTALLVHRKTGGNLAVLLERLARVVRDRLDFRRQSRAATAAGRFATGLIVTVAPLVVVYLAIFQTEYLERFFHQPLGWTLLVLAGALHVFGLVWITSILRNDY
jgi:tight adherence protein B